MEYTEKGFKAWKKSNRQSGQIAKCAPSCHFSMKNSVGDGLPSLTVAEYFAGLGRVRKGGQRAEVRHDKNALSVAGNRGNL